LRVGTTRNQQVARIDYESDREIGGTLQDAVLRKVKELAARTDVVLISDYQKGTITAAVAAAAIEAARARGVPSLVDPKVPHIDRYAGATLVTPNHHEAGAVTLMRIRSGEGARGAAQRFQDRARAAAGGAASAAHGLR